MIFASPDAMTALWDDTMTDGVRTRRVLAWLVDIVLVGLLVWTAWWSLVLLGLVTFGLGWTLLAVLPLVPFAYHCLFISAMMSATPGQALFGLIVRREADLGQPGLMQAVVSTLVFYVTLATSGLLLLVSLFTDRKRTLHDIAAGLVVVRARAWRHWALTGGPGSWNMAGGPHAP